MAYSIDGRNWSAVSSSFGTTNINSITYGLVNAVNGFVVAGAEGKIATSAVAN
jgi:hypothetical protein